MKQPCLHLKIPLLVFASLLCIHLSAQQFVSVLNKLNAGYRQEKVYLHFDRTLYNPGEMIWFKAYLFAGNFPSVISTTLYAELLDTKGKVLQQVTLPVILSSAAGSMEIPADVGGTVFVRAYTKWMLNFDSSFLYTKAIAVTRPQKAADKTPGSASAVLRLFPEGGDLVEGVESKVAFKATDHHGMPVDITGEVLDSKGARVIVFKSEHDGMGAFLFQPKKGEQYKAVWGQQGPAQATPLPAAKQDGIVLETENAGDEIHFTIKHPLSKPPPYPFVYIVAQMHQQLLYRGKASFDKVSAPSGTIPVKGLPAGIIQITVFTPEEEPLAERIVFANSSSAGYAFPTSLNMVAGDTIKRGKNTMEIEVPDSLSCNLSVAVTDADLTPAGQSDNIYSSLLLTSDIKGFVHDPVYYFSGDADSLARHLDLVMMTNGWRRFSWKAVLAGQFPDLHYPPGDYISVEGQVQRLNAKLLEGEELNGVMEYKNKGKEFLNVPVQPDGKFGLSGMIFYDTARLFYHFNKDKKKDLASKARFVIRTDLLEGPLHLSPDELLSTGITRPDTATLAKDKDFVYRRQTSEEAFKKAGLLKAATVIGKKKTKKDLMDEEYTRGAFSDPVSGNKLILPDDDPAFLASRSLLSYLQGRVAGLQVDPDSMENAITWRGWPTALFVDEVSQQSMSFKRPGKVTEDASYILGLSMSDIAMVKIFDPPFFGAWGSGPGGAIAVYLRKPGDRKQAPNTSDYSLLRGYTPVKEFYSPDYSGPAAAEAPDYRATLYWNPFVLTDKGHRKVSLTFYNNDVTKNMRVIIEGCDVDGKLTRIERVVSGAGK